MAISTYYGQPGGGASQVRTAEGGLPLTRTLSSAMVENHTERIRTPFGSFRRDTNRRGYALDLNGDGRYTKGRDGVLAFDLNGDGKVSGNEITKSRKMLMSYSGNFDFNADGQVNAAEQRKGQQFALEIAQRYDLNCDGQLSRVEMERMGGRVMVDGNRDGLLTPGEAHTLNNISGMGRSTLEYVNPYMGTSGLSAPGWF